MIAANLKLTLNAMGKLLAAGNVRGLASCFECPLPVYLNDKFMLFHCREKIAESMTAYILAAARCQIRRIEPCLVRVEDSTPNRSLFVARWSCFQDDGTCASSSIVRYVGRRGDVDGMMRIELVEYLEAGRTTVPAHLFGVIDA